MHGAGSLRFNSVAEFCDGLPGQIKSVKGDGDCFFRHISYLLADMQEFRSAFEPMLSSGQVTEEPLKCHNIYLIFRRL